MFGAIHATDAPAIGALTDIARDFTPRFEIVDDRAVVLDLDGLARLFGDACVIGHELHLAATARGVCARIVMARTSTAARLLAAAGEPAVCAAALSPDRRLPGDDLPPEVTVVPHGAEAAALAPLPIELLATMNVGSTTDRGAAAPANIVTTLHRWGLRTLGDLAALPADAVAARLGRTGVQWRRLARGDDLRPLRPAVAEERFEQVLDLEWPVEGMEPLSFVLGRLLEPLAGRLERRGRSAVALRLYLHLVTRTVHERVLQLPAPMRDARTFRTLLLLDLESHPPPAAIDRVVIEVEPTPARVLQFSLLARSLPAPEQLSTLMARLAALMGDGRCGSPRAVDSWRPGAHAMALFAPREAGVSRDEGSTVRERTTAALRRFRIPVAARVRVEEGRPVSLATGRRDLRGGRVEACAGPWRTSGMWWAAQEQPRAQTPRPRAESREAQRPEPGAQSPAPRAQSREPRAGPRQRPWDRDEWDVTLSEGVTCRLFRDRATGAWFVEGIVD